MQNVQQVVYCQLVEVVMQHVGVVDDCARLNWMKSIDMRLSSFLAMILYYRHGDNCVSVGR